MLEELPAEITRRSFLRSTLGFGAGALLGGTVLPPIAVAAESGAEAVGFHADNPGLQEAITEYCAPETAKIIPRRPADTPATNTTPRSDTKCADRFLKDPANRRQATIVAPLMEECMFRASPSLVLDFFLQDPENLPGVVLAGGTDYLHFTAPEIAVGALSTAVFGVVHNITSKGLAVDNLPITPLIGGSVLWGLTRKAGLPAGIITHMTFNKQYFGL